MEAFGVALGLEDGSRISDGQPVALARLTERGTAIARDRAAWLLDDATARTALALLDWAAAWDLGLPAACLEQYGQSCRIGEPPTPELPQLLRRGPARPAGPAGRHYRRARLSRPRDRNPGLTSPRAKRDRGDVPTT